MADTSLLDTANLMARFTSEGELWWCLLGIDPASGNSGKPKIILQAEGDTDIDSLKAHLLDDQLQYGCIKVLGVDTKGAVVSTRMKLVFFQWVGPRVPKLKASKAIPTKAALQSYFQGHHLALEVYDKSALTAADIEARLRAAGGAHQPSDMKFGSGTTVKVLAMPVEGEAAAAAETPKAEAAPAPAPAPAPAVASTPLKPVGLPVKEAPAKAETANIFTAFSEAKAGHGGHSSGAGAVKASPEPAHKVGVASVAKAKDEAAATVAAVGKAAAALKDLLASGKPVSTADLQAFVDGPLGAAAVRSAATLSVLSDL